MKRSPIVRKTPLKRTAMKAGRRITARPKKNPMPEGRADEVKDRDNHQCQAYAYGWETDKPCDGRLEIHHRKTRGTGGTSDPSTHDLDNLIALCSVHHAEVTARPADAYACGLAERRNVVAS